MIQLVDAYNHVNRRRTEFRLEQPGKYLSNMKVLDLGFTQTTDVNTNHLTGCLAHIQNIFIMDGNLELDSIRDFNYFMGFKNYNNTNEFNVSLGQVLKKHNQGYQLVVQKGTALADPDMNTLIQHNNDVPDVSLAASDARGFNKNTNAEATTSKSWVDLSEISDFMRSVKVIDTDLFKNFRVIVEYTQDVRILSQGGAGDQPVNVSVQPTLSVQYADQMTAQEVQQMLNKGMLFTSIERDIVNVPLVSAVQSVSYTEQKNNLKYNGFNKKYVKKMLLHKESGNPSVATCSSLFYRLLGSEKQLQEKLQVKVNGKPLFPTSNGIVENNERLAHLSDSWGLCNTIPGHQLAEITDSDNYIWESDEVVGHLDYYGFNVEQRIDDLQMEYIRSGRWITNQNTTNNDKFNQPLNLRLFGQVVKQIKFMGDKYNLSYV